MRWAAIPGAGRSFSRRERERGPPIDLKRVQRDPERLRWLPHGGLVVTSLTGGLCRPAGEEYGSDAAMRAFLCAPPDCGRLGGVPRDRTHLVEPLGQQSAAVSRWRERPGPAGRGGVVSRRAGLRRVCGVWWGALLGGGWEGGGPEGGG